MRTFHTNLTFEELQKIPSNKEGSVSIFVRDFMDVADFNTIYGRDNIALKLCKVSNTERWISAVRPGVIYDTVEDNTITQNLYSLVNLSPRVYDVVKIIFNDRDFHYGQIVEIVSGEVTKMSYSKQEMFIAYGKSKGINIGNIDLRNDNYMDDKIIDLNNFMFNKNTYKEYLVPLIKKGGAWLSNTPYHTIEELDIVGTRKITDRPKELCLDEIDFKGKTVLDVGSAMGNMVREYSKRGAKRVIGVDIKYYPEISKQIDYYLGYFNNDYYGYNETINLSKDQLNNIIRLRKQTGIVKYDILSFLSVVNHVPFTRDIAFLADTIIFEGHAQNTEEQIENWLKPYYNTVTKIKERSELNNRLAYIGTNL